MKLGKATREAFGLALAQLGETHTDIVVVDCDVGNSTRTLIFNMDHQPKKVAVNFLKDVLER